MKKRPLGVYIHIPFCRSKCLYCAFNSVAVEAFSPEEWVRLFGLELSGHLRGKDFSPATHELRSIYFGGGTPSLLSSSAIGALVSLIRETFTCHKNLEITLEANPEGLGLPELEGFLKAGVNRLSIGVQSLADNELKTLGRRHSAEDALKAVKRAEQAGFTNVSIDLMYGLPGQTLKSWTETLEKIVALSPAHISLYNLSIEEHTPFFELYPPLSHGGGEQKPFIDEELEYAMYERAIDKLTAQGYCHYEISNFAQRGFKSLHNEGYWLGSDYIGLGPGAHSFSSSGEWGRRSWNEGDIESYKRALSNGKATAGSEALLRDEAMVEAVMLGLRMLDNGIDLSRYTEAFGDKARLNLIKRCSEYERGGLLHITENKVVLGRSALFTSNELCLALVS